MDIVRSLRQMDRVLGQISDAPFCAAEGSILDSITERLCKGLGADAAFVGQLLSERTEKTLEFTSCYMNGARTDRHRCLLKGTPCEKVIEEGSLAMGQGVCLQFPSDPLLARMEAQSYVGTRLLNDENVPIGLIGVVSRKPIEDTRAVEALQQILALPVALELARRREITARKLVELRLNSILSIAQEAIIAIDVDYRIVVFNKGAEKIFGYETDEVIGESLDILLPDNIRRRHGELMARFMESNEMSRLMDQRIGKLVGQRKDGGEFPIEASITKMQAGDGLLAIAILRDISRRRRSEKALQYAQKMRTVGNLAAGLAHDFNNILTVIRGTIGLALTADVDESRIRTHLSVALRESDRGAELVSRLMSFGRSEVANPIIVDPGRVIDGLSQMLRLTIGERIETRIERDARVWGILVDPCQLESAIVNLAFNARDAMDAPGPGRLTIRVTNVEIEHPTAMAALRLEKGSYVRIQVQDTGRGMDVATKSSALEPFYSTKRESGGTGLGLSMVSAFVRSSGGTIKILSAESQGTTVELYLPKATSDAGESDDTRQIDAVGGNETLLIVEDHPEIRSLAVMYAQSLGYQTVEAGDGMEALEILRLKQPIDLIFTDFQLPGGLSGLDLVRRAQARYPKTKILLSSGYGRLESSAGKYPLLSKPYSCQTLASMIREVLDS